jgi:hypothetical protein
MENTAASFKLQAQAFAAKAKPGAMPWNLELVTGTGNRYPVTGNQF